MAFSRRITTVAIFRGLLGPKHGQEEQFAELAGRSVSWVKKVSAGLVMLSEEAALVLEERTGISAVWLLQNDTNAPPESVAGKPYDFAEFEHHRAHRYGDRLPLANFPDSAGLASAIAEIGAGAAGQGRRSLFNYRLSRFLSECRAEFGLDKSAAPDGAGVLPAGGTWENSLDVQLL